jgi:hypothetical protein
MMRKTFTVITLGLFTLFVAGCRESAQPTPTPATNAQIELAYEPDPPQTGEGAILVTVTGDTEVQSVNVRGDMNHAGMVPVIGETSEAEEANTYRVPFHWSMGGDWILTVEVTLADGSKVSEEFTVTVGS